MKESNISIYVTLTRNEDPSIVLGMFGIRIMIINILINRKINVYVHR